jgi:cell division transport system permease protein
VPPSQFLHLGTSCAKLPKLFLVAIRRISNALAQVGDNPFLPSLNIMTTGNPLQYQQVADVLQSDKFNQLVERVDYSEKKDTIEKVFYITRDINNYGLVTVVILVILAILVVLNTIKLAIDSSKEEITTMRMVGASSWFVRAPFIIQGILFGSISFVICFVFTLLLSYLLSSKLAFVMPGFSLSAYFIKNLWLIILIQFGFGAGLGALSSIIVVNKYLKM